MVKTNKKQNEDVLSMSALFCFLLHVTNCHTYQLEQNYCPNSFSHFKLCLFTNL